MSRVSCSRISLAPDEVIFSSHVTTQELLIDGLGVPIGPERGVRTDEEHRREDYKGYCHVA